MGNSKVFAHRVSLYGWDFLQNIVGSLTYIIKHIEEIAVVIWCYIQ